jgi:hypothetical protein
MINDNEGLQFLYRKCNDYQKILTQQTCQLQKLQTKYDDLHIAYNTLKKEDAKLKNGRIYNSDFFQLSIPQQEKIKQKIRWIQERLSLYLGSYNLIVPKISIYKMADPQNCTINILEVENDENAVVALYLKDKLHISDANYKEIRSLMSYNWPTFYAVQKIRISLNQELLQNIKSNSKGFYLNVKTRMEQKLSDFLKTTEKSDIGKITIKFSADSTNVGQRLQLLNIAFSIVNDKANCKTEYGHYIIGNIALFKMDFVILLKKINI